MGVARELSKLYSENNFLAKGEDGRGEFERVGSRDWPKTRPVAAAATTVPVPTSCGSREFWSAKIIYRAQSKGKEKHFWF